MATATYLRTLEDFNGDARLYRFDPPMQVEHFDYESNTSVLEAVPYAIVSAVVVTGSGPETYIFSADEMGEILSFCELEGSYRGALDHDAALAGAGYDVVHADD